MSSNPTPLDLRAALAEEPPEDRAALERVWHLLGEAAPAAADTDLAWRELSGQLALRDATRRRAADRPARRASARPASARRRWVLPAALAAAVAAVAVWVALPATHTAAPGQTLALTLPDGSAVTLAPGAELRHPRRFGAERAVALTGEAFFEVVPAAETFSVTTHNARVAVLGTAFNVRAWDGETAVALVEGRVRVEAGAAQAELAPGEALTVAGGAIAPRAADVAREAAWRQGALSFDDRPLGTVLADVERRYGVAIAAAPGAPLGARVSAFYADRPPLPVLLGDLGAVAGARFSADAGGYRVRAADPSPTPPDAPAGPPSRPSTPTASP